MIVKYFKISFIFLVLFLLTFEASIFQASKAEANKKSFVIGLLPEMNIFKQRERFELLAPYIKEHMGIDVRLTMLTYSNVIEKFKNEEIDAAFLGSFTGALAISKLGVVPLVRPVNIDNTSTYQGYIFTRKDNNIRAFSDMQGKSLALVEETTAGFLFPMAWFKQYGVDDINTLFAEQFISGSHDRTIALVLNGKADVGAAKSTIYNNMRKWQPRIDRELIVLAKSATVPSNSLCVSQRFDQQFRNQLKDLLLNLRGDKAGREALKQMGAKRFVETDIAQYQPVFELAQDAGIDLEKYGL